MDVTPQRRFPIHPKHPERICWGCERCCPADDLSCGNGNSRAQHPAELLGEDWFELLDEHDKEALTPP
jgi:hypothetical protein